MFLQKGFAKFETCDLLDAQIFCLALLTKLHELALEQLFIKNNLMVVLKLRDVVVVQSNEVPGYYIDTSMVSDNIGSVNENTISVGHCVNGNILY